MTLQKLWGLGRLDFSRNRNDPYNTNMTTQTFRLMT